MKKLLFLLSLAVATPLAVTSCSSHTTLEAGGVYTDPILATTDQSILDASKALTGFVQWANANATFLARWPEVGQLAAKVDAGEKGWIRDAYAARDAYAEAAKAYRLGKGSAPDAQRAKLNGALAVLLNLTQQIAAYRTTHSNA